jgi:hypothetical protein
MDRRFFPSTLLYSFPSCEGSKKRVDGGGQPPNKEEEKRRRSLGLYGCIVVVVVVVVVYGCWPCPKEMNDMELARMKL